MIRRSAVTDWTVRLEDAQSEWSDIKDQMVWSFIDVNVDLLTAFDLCTIFVFLLQIQYKEGNNKSC